MTPRRALFTTLDSTNPEDLWAWMDTERADGPRRARNPRTIPMLRNGQMFALATYEGGDLSADYATARMRNEPLVEITQLKGTSETHPKPRARMMNGAGFEQYDYFHRWQQTS